MAKAKNLKKVTKKVTKERALFEKHQNLKWLLVVFASVAILFFIIAK